MALRSHRRRARRCCRRGRRRVCGRERRVGDEKRGGDEALTRPNSAHDDVGSAKIGSSRATIVGRLTRTRRRGCRRRRARVQNPLATRTRSVAADSATDNSAKTWQISAAFESLVCSQIYSSQTFVSPFSWQQFLARKSPPSKSVSERNAAFGVAKFVHSFKLTIKGAAQVPSQAPHKRKTSLAWQSNWPCSRVASTRQMAKMQIMAPNVV